MADHKLAPQTQDPEENSPLPHVLAVSSITRRLGQEWAEKARRLRFALASGPSGVGKSILMHQVVVPALRAEDAETPITAFMPGDSPDGFFASLWSALGQTGPLPSDYEEALGRALVSSSSSGRSILVIDGFDQIFAHSESEASRALAFIWRLIQEGSATVIGALRSPLVEPIRRLLPDDVPTQDIFVRLSPPGEEDRAILAREGVQLASPELETTDPSIFKRLVREITQELDQAPQALTFLKPLLERWRSQVACGDLSVMNWLRSNGLAGEIATHIEEKFTSLKPRLKKQLSPLLRLLVSWTEDLDPKPRHVLYSEILDLGKDAAELTSVLLYERVLYLSGDDPHAARVKFVHPAILQQWSHAKEIIDEERKDLSARRLLKAQALHWDSNGRRKEDQWLEGDLLLMAQTLLQKESSSLPRLTLEFLKTFDNDANQPSSPPRKLREVIKPLSLLIILFSITRGLLEMTHADLGSSGPIIEATASRASSDSAPSSRNTPKPEMSDNHVVVDPQDDLDPEPASLAH